MIFKSKLVLVTLLGLLLVFSGCSLITQSYVQPIQSISPTVSATRLEHHVRVLSEQFYPRNYQTLDNLNGAADYIKQQLQQSSPDVTEQTYTVQGQTYRNIIARFGPSEGKVIVIGAHYDSCADTPGADDNASGVAGLLELAQLLKDNPPSQAVELVAYTLEEPPFFRSDYMGSAIHARSLVEQQRQVSVMISLEMIGYFDDQANSQAYPIGFLHWLYPEQGNFIAIAGRFSDISLTKQIKALMAGASPLAVHSINAPSQIQGLDFSDHLNYWAQGINAVMITDTAFYRNSNYHQLTDNAESLNYQAMANVVQGVFAVTQGFKP